jgi:hypothetical protein
MKTKATFKDLDFDITYDKNTSDIKVACRIKGSNNILGEIYSTYMSKDGKQDVNYFYNNKIILHSGDQTNKIRTRMCEMLLIALLSHEDIIDVE